MPNRPCALLLSEEQVKSPSELCELIRIVFGRDFEQGFREYAAKAVKSVFSSMTYNAIAVNDDVCDVVPLASKTELPCSLLTPAQWERRVQ